MIYESAEPSSIKRALKIFILLLFAHAVCDAGFQTHFIGTYKSPLEFHPSGVTMWPTVLSAHGLINGAGVYVVTGMIWLGVAETISHITIDFCSSMGWIGHYPDQLMHLMTKLWWLGFALKYSQRG